MGSILYDLVGAKKWSSVSFISLEPESISIQPILEFYYDRVQNDTFQDGCIKKIDSSQSVCIYGIEGNALLLIVFDTPDLSLNEEIRITEFVNMLTDRIRKKGTREASKSFSAIAGELLREEVHVTFISDATPWLDNRSGIAVARMVTFLRKKSYIAMGPYNIKISLIPFSRVIADFDTAPVANTAGYALILGKPIPDLTIIQGVVQNIRSISSTPMLIVPGSDDQLELARKYEQQFQIDLCDSVSEKPTYLLLSVLAILGMSDMHPEYAANTWPMDSDVDNQDESEGKEERHEQIGHQAFYVVDKNSGDPVFTYFYVSQDEVFQRAPNVVAAITSFSMGTTEGNKTSVVQVENLVYALIEVDDLIFTLVTGQTEDVESIRLQFSFLPDLWRDEKPEFLESTGDPYSSPPFTLKLLATLPPEEFHGRMRPCRVREPEWNKFESKEVRDFLKAVWGSLDGTIQLSTLANGTGPKMTLGAIHFLNAMGSIEMKLDVRESDVPILVCEIDADLRNIYSHLDPIASLMDGEHTVKMISERTKIQVSVLITVISDLYSRGIVTFKD